MLKKLNSAVYENFIDSFSVAAPVDGWCFGTVLLRNIHFNHIYERIIFHPKEWFVSIVKKACWIFGVSNVKLMESSAKL